MLLQREFPAREINVAQLRVGFLRDGIDLFQDVLRIGTEQQRRAPKDHEVPRLTIRPLASRDQPGDFLGALRRLVGPPVGEGDVAREPAQTEARRIAPEGDGHRGIGFPVAARGEEHFHAEQLPVGIPRRIAESRLGLREGHRVVAGQKRAPRLRRLRRGQRPEPNQQQADGSAPPPGSGVRSARQRGFAHSSSVGGK